MDDPNDDLSEYELYKQRIKKQERNTAFLLKLKQDKVEKQERLKQQASAHAYKNFEQQRLVDRFKKIERELTSTVIAQDIFNLENERLKISFQLVDWIRDNYPNSFRVFEFNGEDQPMEKYLQSLRLPKNLGKTGRAITRPFIELVNNYGLKQDDIVIFHPTTKRPHANILYMTSDDRASTGVILKRITYPDTLLETMDALGLTPEAAQSLYFPRGGYKLFV